MQLVPISVLCVAPKSNYYDIPALDLWPAERDAYNYTGHFPIIAHPPCAQWSRLHKFSKANKREKNLALFCWEYVQKNGGILEHPAGSSLFKFVGADRKKIISVDQHWWNFPARKRTYLYFNGVAAGAFPLNMDCYSGKVEESHSSRRAIMPLEFCEYLVNCFRA